MKGPRHTKSVLMLWYRYLYMILFQGKKRTFVHDFGWFLVKIWKQVCFQAPWDGCLCYIWTKKVVSLRYHFESICISIVSFCLVVQMRNPLVQVLGDQTNLIYEYSVNCQCTIHIKSSIFSMSTDKGWMKNLVVKCLVSLDSGRQIWTNPRNRKTNCRYISLNRTQYSIISWMKLYIFHYLPSAVHSHVNIIFVFVLQNLFRQQQKVFQQTRIVQSQRLKTIKQLHEQYVKVIIILCAFLTLI